MNKLNWRDASKELPNGDAKVKYLVITSKRPSFDIAKFDGKSFWIDDPEHGSVNLMVEHYCPLNEIPLPEE